MVREVTSIMNESPQQIALMFSLPGVLSMIADVTVPAGTRMNTGTANKLLGGAGGGGNSSY